MKTNWKTIGTAVPELKRGDDRFNDAAKSFITGFDASESMASALSELIADKVDEATKPLHQQLELRQNAIDVLEDTVTKLKEEVAALKQLPTMDGPYHYRGFDEMAKVDGDKIEYWYKQHTNGKAGGGKKDSLKQQEEIFKQLANYKPSKAQEEFLAQQMQQQGLTSYERLQLEMDKAQREGRDEAMMNQLRAEMHRTKAESKKPEAVYPAINSKKKWSEWW